MPRYGRVQSMILSAFCDTYGTKTFIVGFSWIELGVFPLSFNMTNIVLISKGDELISMKCLRSIALCNVLYKVISKILAN